MSIRLLPALCVLSFCLFRCSSSTSTAPAAAPPAPTLQSVYADNFVVGAALGVKHVNGEDTAGQALVAREFSTITPENMMKWEEINPARGVYNWENPDAYVQFGENNDMFVVGHALVWYLQLSEYVKEVKDPDTMRAVLKEHIDAVAGRYKGRIDGWDVLNEAIDDAGEGALREWSVPDVLGPDYVTEVFMMAREAAPDAELYYNDYNAWQPKKRAGMIRLLERALANGAPIDGVGIQGHYSLDSPTLGEIEAAINDFAELGLPIMFTEVDVNVLPNPYNNLTADPRISFENTPFMNPYPDPASLPDSIQTALADRYEDLFKLFLKHDDKITRVTFWGVNDGHSWLNGWPVKGRTNHPLLLDRENRKKPAYERVMSLR